MAGKPGFKSPRPNATKRAPFPDNRQMMRGRSEGGARPERGPRGPHGFRDQHKARDHRGFREHHGPHDQDAEQNFEPREELEPRLEAGPRLHGDLRLRISHASAIEHFVSHNPDLVAHLEIDRPRDEIKGRLAQIIEQAGGKGIQLLYQRHGHGGEPVTAVLKDFPFAELTDLIATLAGEQKAGLIALDHIQDPHNFGAICRSAEAFGCKGVIFPKDRASTMTPVVVHASAGAVATLPICKVTNMGEALRKLKAEGYWIIGSSLGEKSMPPWQVPDFDKWVLVIGSEGDGMARLIRELCDVLVQIPLHGHVQSLNASTAASTLLYELTRPRAPK